MNNRRPPQIFDRSLVRIRRARSATGFADHNFLHARAMDDIIDRLETVNRDFPKAVFAGAGGLTEMLTPRCGVGEIVHMDTATSRLPARRMVCTADEECLPLARERIDLFVSLLTLHTANDLVGALAQARRSLRPDGLFIAAIFAEQTLRNFRNALYTAETEITGGVSARIAPFAAIQDLGQALSRAGFALPVTDLDKVEVRYRDPTSLIRDLRGMGETRALASPSAPLRRGVIHRAMELFMEAGGGDRFDIVYLTGWAPHETQQKPLKPGSAKSSLSDAIKKFSN